MLQSVSPTLQVADMRRALAYFEGRLGFQCTFKLDDAHHPEIPYAIVERDQVEIHLQLNARSSGASGCYITVTEGIDALYGDFLKAGATVKRPIEDSNYGMRDFNIADADGNTLGFGQSIAGK